MGVLAIVPLVAFFGFGVLSKDDFNGFLWWVGSSSPPAPTRTPPPPAFPQHDFNGFL